MSDKIRLVYLDEEESWQSQVHAALNANFDLHIPEPEQLPRNIEELWDSLKDFDAQAILIDYRLNESGLVSYTGDDVIREFHKHNKHLPMFIITSYEDNALIECKEAQIIRDKELITHADKLIKLQNIIVAGVNNYNKRKESAEKIIFSLQNKLKYNEILSQDEENMKFEAELYLSELDLDSNVHTNLITNSSNRTLDELLSMARQIVEIHKK